MQLGWSGGPVTCSHPAFTACFFGCCSHTPGSPRLGTIALGCTLPWLPSRPACRAVVDDVLPPSFVKRIDGPTGSLAAELRHKCELHLTAKHRSVVWWYGRPITCLDWAPCLPSARTGQPLLPCAAAQSSIGPPLCALLMLPSGSAAPLLACYPTQLPLLLSKSASTCPCLRAARSGWRAAGAAARASSLTRPRTRSAACCRWGAGVKGSWQQTNSDSGGHALHGG